MVDAVVADVRDSVTGSVDISGSAKSVSKVIETEGRESLPMAVTGLILCGGRSRRMGRPKAFLPFEGKTIIEHQIDTVCDLFDEIFLVANDPDAYSNLPVDTIKDILPYRGPLGGILSGLLVSSNHHAFVMACDKPLVDRRLIRHMASRRHDSDVVVLSHGGLIEPLLAVYSKNCIKPLEEALFSGKFQMEEFLCGLRAVTYQYSEDGLGQGHLPAYFDVDTPQDYSEILSRLRLPVAPLKKRPVTPVMNP